jgi:hypothetical protein
VSEVLSFDPLAAVLGGIQIWDWSDPETREQAYKISPGLRAVHLRYDEVYVARSASALVVGELAHFLYSLHRKELLAETRRAASLHIKRTAERILGEPWEVA